KDETRLQNLAQKGAGRVHVRGREGRHAEKADSGRGHGRRRPRGRRLPQDLPRAEGERGRIHVRAAGALLRHRGPDEGQFRQLVQHDATKEVASTTADERAAMSAARSSSAHYKEGASYDLPFADPLRRGGALGRARGTNSGQGQALR